MAFVLPKFPNVPDVPGVPPVLRNAVASASTLFAQVEDSIGLRGLVLNPNFYWGVYSEGGGVVLIGDSVAAVELNQEYRTSDYPVEQGAFETYNKVALPKQIRITFIKGGSESARARFLKEVEAAVATLSLYSVVTPEIAYRSLNLTNYSYKRDSREGVTLMKVEVWAQEVRVTATSQFTQTREPAGASATDTGTVQPANPTADQLASLKGLF